jgi:uncharacterized protein (DUF169 family)
MMKSTQRKTMSDYRQLHETLTRSLDLPQAPVAISLAESLPTGVPLYTGTLPAGCGFWQEGATRTFATTARQHELCSIGVYTHNLEMSKAAQTDLNDTLAVLADLGYLRAEDVPQVPVLQSRPKYLIYGPLAEAPVAPDLVLLFVKPGQILILSEATQQTEGGTLPALGRPACAIVPQAMNTGKTAMSLGCCGARAYLDVLTPETALFAIPGERLEAFTERVAVLAKANGILNKFHSIRRVDVEAGGTPTIKQSLARLQG